MIKYYVDVNIIYKIFNDMRKHLSSVENTPIHKGV